MKLAYTLGELIQFATILLLIKHTIIGITYNTFVIKEGVDALPFVKWNRHPFNTFREYSATMHAA